MQPIDLTADERYPAGATGSPTTSAVAPNRSHALPQTQRR